MIKENFQRGRYLHLMLEAMSYDDAVKLLGLSGQWSSDDLTKAYRIASIKNHPDKGGSTETMAMINVAYEQLKKSGAKADYNSREWWEARRKDEKIRAEKWRNYIITSLDMDAFVQYFTETFGVGFKGEIKATKSTYTDSAGWFVNIEFTDVERTKVFKMNISADHDTQFNKSKGLGSDSDPDIDIGVFITANAYVNNRDVKITQKGYTFNTSKSTYTDPTKVFPKAKISKSQEARKYTRRDAVSFFEKELKGIRNASGDGYYVPISGNKDSENSGYFVEFSRNVFMRVANWGIFVREKNSKWAMSGALREFSYISMPEDENLPSRAKAIVNARDANELKRNIEYLKHSLGKQ